MADQKGHAASKKGQLELCRFDVQNKAGCKASPDCVGQCRFIWSTYKVPQFLVGYWQKNVLKI